MEHSCLSVALIAPFEIVFRVDAHVGSGHEDVFIVGDVDAGRIVHLVVSARGDRERADGAFAVVEDRIDVGREDGAVMVVDCNGRIGPP